MAAGLHTKGCRARYSVSMPNVNSHGLRIHYRTGGKGEPLVLVHGYTASSDTNWVRPGWVEFLAPHQRLLLPDLRGHGKSEKPWRSSAYSLPLMAADVLAAMDAEGIGKATAFGYSMGGMVTLELLLNHPERVSAAIIGGMGSYFPRGRKDKANVSGDDDEGTESSGRRSLSFLAAYLGQADPIALNAVFRSVFKGKGPVDASRLGEIRVPVLCTAGTKDAFFEPTKALASAIPGARFVPIPGEGHISAIRNPRFRTEVAAFLQQAPAGVRQS